MDADYVECSECFDWFEESDVSLFLVDDDVVCSDCYEGD
jgi:formylmethanofuran dehydrogenase subunit E